MQILASFDVNILALKMHACMPPFHTSRSGTVNWPAIHVCGLGKYPFRPDVPLWISQMLASKGLLSQPPR